MEYLKKALPPEKGSDLKLFESVKEIIEDVKLHSDNALLKYNEKFDGSHRKQLLITKEEINRAYENLTSELITSIKFAASNIKAFAEAQKSTFKELDSFEVQPGVFLGHKNIPIDSCCCYVPGGGYPLFSTALMLAIPAKVAGVPRITACSPCKKGTSEIDSATLVALDIAGVDEIYAVGGAHAIAAFSYGTNQIKPVNIIVGPGNKYVTEAKRQCYGQVGIDFVAGPSEVLIIADKTSDPEIIAADLLGQSEHDLNASGILLVSDKKVGLAAIEAVERQLKTLSTAETASISWKNNGEVIFSESIDELINISNEKAPEHLELACDNPNAIINKLTNYGSLFIGDNSAEVFGDYVAGTNHTLPTLRAARYTGGVWVGTFIKTVTNQRIETFALENMINHASLMAKSEGLAAHSNAAEIRRKLL